MARLTRTLATLVSLVTFVGAIDYCHITSCAGIPHVLCRSSVIQSNQRCGQLKFSGLTEHEKRKILDIHNTFRAKVANGLEIRGNPGPQPPGKIPSLVWDKELTSIAQTLANNCINGGSNICKNTDRFRVGQNMLTRESNVKWDENVAEAITDWYNHVENFDSNDVESFRIKSEVGIYTQLVWGDTTHVGCGLAKFKNGRIFKTVLVCNYGPAGNSLMNHVGLPVYEIIKKETPTVDYYDMKLCNGKKHTMCMFKSTNPARACGQMGPSELTEAEIREIVDVHNGFRRKVAEERESRGNPGPQPAGKIPSLQWDNELAIVAQRWAIQCQPGKNDECRNLPHFTTVQNVAVQSENKYWTTTMTELVTNWYDTVKDFNSNEVENFRSQPKIRPYAQNVWGETSHVGCGVARFKDGRNFKTSLICNYGSTNNKIPNSAGSAVHEIKQDVTPTPQIFPKFPSPATPQIVSKSPSPSRPVDYCNIESCRGKPHTMCEFRTTRPGRMCNQMSAGLTGTEMKEILDLHNECRKKVASGNEKRGNPGPQPAGKIPPLEWDDELATIAQRWANQCQFEHDTCRNTPRSEAGQNLAIMGYSSRWRTTISELFDLWYDEVELFDSNEVASFRYSKKTGHYTQLVWGTTTHVGCGLTRFKDGVYFQTFLVCNYSPAGNRRFFNNVGLPVYETYKPKQSPSLARRQRPYHFFF